MGRRLRLVRPPVGAPRTDVAALIERHAEHVVHWLVLLVQGYTDPTASPAELRDLREDALHALGARLAALAADLRSSAR